MTARQITPRQITPRHALRRSLRSLSLVLAAGSLAACMQTADASRLMGDISQSAAQLQSLAGGQPALAGAGATPVASTGPARSRPVQSPHPDAHHIDWDTKFTRTGLANRKLIGHEFRFYCPPAPSRMTPRRVYGTDVYRFDVWICRAAVHAGKIDLNGGNVTLKMLEGNVKLRGSTRNGITSKNGSSGVRSTVFVN